MYDLNQRKGVHMNLKNFNWNEQAIDQVNSNDVRYTTYNGYASHDYHTEAKADYSNQTESSDFHEELSAL